MRRLFILCVILAVGPVTMVAAHGSHDHTIRVMMRANQVELVVTVDSGVFQAFDKNEDGVLSVAEFEKAFDAINAYVDQQVVLVDQKGLVVAPHFRDLPVQGIADLQPSHALPDVKIRRRYELADAAPQMLKFDLLSTANERQRYLLFSTQGRRAGTISGKAPIIPLS